MSKKTKVPDELVRAVKWELHALDGAAMHLKPLVALVNRRLHVCGYVGAHSERMIRRAIAEAIDNPDYAAPIGSSQRGYYWITRYDDLDEARNDLWSRANELQARAAKLTENYAKAQGKTQTQMFAGDKAR